MARKPTDIINLKLRLSEALRRRLEKEAARNDRSMNAEIIHRLEQSFEPRPLDLYGLLAGALNKAKEKYGPDDPEALNFVTGPICAALLQLLPKLHSVEVALLDDDGRSKGASNISYSPNGWDRIETKGDLL